MMTPSSLRKVIPWAPLLPALLCGCGKVAEPQAPEPRKPSIYTTFYPTRYFAERIAGGLVEVACPLPAGADPIFWQPSREVLAEYQAATLIVLNGAEFEKWAATASLPRSRVVDTARPFAKDLISMESTTHSHGGAGRHTHEGTDGHTWLDPVLAEVQAEEIRKAMVQRFPEHRRGFEAGFGALRGDLQALQRRFEALAPRLAGRIILCSHPAYNYPARRYGWEIRNFDLDPEQPLTEEEVAALREACTGPRPTLLFWESEPAPETQARLRAEGIESLLFSPCESWDEAATGTDYLGVMIQNLDRLAAALDAAPEDTPDHRR